MYCRSSLPPHPQTAPHRVGNYTPHEPIDRYCTCMCKALCTSTCRNVTCIGGRVQLAAFTWSSIALFIHKAEFIQLSGSFQAWALGCWFVACGQHAAQSRGRGRGGNVSMRLHRPLRKVARSMRGQCAVHALQMRGPRRRSDDDRMHWVAAARATWMYV